MSLRKLLIPICLLALLGAGVYAWREIPRANPFAQIPREKVLQGDFIISIEEVGVIKARKQESIFAPFGGKITKLHDDGTTVAKDQIVIWLDTEDVEKQLDQQITNLKSTKTDLERTIEQLLKGVRNNTLKVESAVAELEFARLKLLEVNQKLETIQLLVDRNILAKTNVDSAQQDVESEKFQTLKTDLDFRKDMKEKKQDESSQKAELGKVKLRSLKAQKRIEEAQDKITQAEIKSPSDGIFLLVERYNWQKGANVKPQPGDQVWRSQILAEIPDLSSLVILSQVSEEDVAHVYEGQEAEITTDAFPDLEIKARIERIGMVAISRRASPAGTILQGSEDTGQKVFELDLVLDGKIDPRLRPGMTANVSIIINTVKNAVTLPFSAIFRKEGRAVVYIVKDSGYEVSSVTLGRRNKDRIQILSGVKKGEEVFLRDLGELDQDS